MNLPILLLRLEGPLQSWGGRSRWDVRDTGEIPTKSGVIGLLGCALGCPVGDARLEELDRALVFGVRVEAPGKILEDYQTITDFLPTASGGYKHSGVAVGTSLSKLRSSPNVTPSTIQSPRFYLEDAAFLIALTPHSSKWADLLHASAGALHSPKWPLFLGRKSCIPTRPIFDRITEEYSSLNEALTLAPHSWLKGKQEERGMDPPSERIAYVEDASGHYVRQDALRVSSGRQYGFLTLRKI